jgi:hypothetical protein
MRRLAAILAGVLTLSLFTAAPPARATDTLTIDFETGPALGTAINDDYLGSAFTRFLEPDVGFRPYRRSAPSQARSGTVVADVGRDVCFKDTGDAQGCEFVTPGMTGRLTRTASSVTLYAGLFENVSGASARLTAYRANGTVAGTGNAVPIGASFTTPVTVSSASADIARFYLTVEGPGALNAALGFDDLTLEFPANSLPDISVSAPTQITTLRQGASTDIPVDVTRLNGSNGPVDLSVTGLPSGVNASFTPNPLPTTQASATMTLIASSSAPEFLQPRELLITADPAGNANVAPAPRTATTQVTLVTNFELSVPTATDTVDVPACAAADLVFRVRRSLAFAQNAALTLSVESGSALTGEILPSPDMPAGGNLSEERILRLRWTGDPKPPQGVVVRARSPGLPDRVLTLIARPAVPSAQVQDSSGLAPRRGQPGSRITLNGNGFCPGTTVQVGNELATADTDVAGDSRSLTFRIPRLGTDGPVAVVPPTGQTYTTSNTLAVTTFRNREGFAFDNYKYGWLSFGELTDLVGVDDMFVKVNPCWPFGKCTIVTGVPDPLAYLTWGILNIALHESGGHCFGISRTLQELLAGKVSYGRFAPGATWPHQLPSASGPNSAMSTWLDGRHAGQGTSEFLAAWLVRDRNLTTQLNRVRSELQAGRYPGISLTDGFSGHVVTAYDVENQPDGSVKIYVYDNNRPFTSSELTNKETHRQAEAVGSVITIKPDGKTWTFAIDSDTTYTGGGADFYAVPLSAIPDDPSLPGIPSLDYFTFFGSPGAAATVRQVPKGADYLPALDSNAVPGAAGTVVSPRKNGPVRIGIRGRVSGEYSQTVTGSGFVAGVREVRTAKGVDDQLRTDPAAGEISFAGERRRALNLDLAVRNGAVRRSASVATTTATGGQEVVRFRKGRKLIYQHQGPATTMSFTLIDVGRTGAQRFESGPVTVPKDARVTAKPRRWRSLDSVRLTVKSGSKSTTRLVGNKARTSTKLRLLKPRIKKRNVVVGYRVKRAPKITTLGVVVRLKAGGRTAKLTKGRSDPGRRGKIAWKKQLKPGVYRGTVRTRLVIGGENPGTVTKSRKVRLRVR